MFAYYNIPPSSSFSNNYMEQKSLKNAKMSSTTLTTSFFFFATLSKNVSCDARQLKYENVIVSRKWKKVQKKS